MVIKKIYLKLLLTTFFWGGTFVAARIAVREAPPFTAATVRFLIAGAVLVALAVRQARQEGSPLPLPKTIGQTALLFSLGLTGVFLYTACFFTGLKLTTATNGSLIVAINPLITAVISAKWLGERVTRPQTAGLLISVAGVAVIISKGSLAVISGLSLNPGDLFMLGAPLCWALYSVLGKKALANFAPLTATAYAAVFGAACLLPAAIAESIHLGKGLPHFSAMGWLAELQLALLGTVVGFVWWYQGIGVIGASKAASFVNLVPLFGTVLAALILSERITGAQLAGGGLVVLGVYLGSGQGFPAGKGVAVRLQPQPASREEEG
ncbi:DMT family transporter [Geomonas sp. Red276]